VSPAYRLIVGEIDAEGMAQGMADYTTAVRGWRICWWV
jgi:hypothetical protein